MGRNDTCFCGSGKKQKNCHADIEESSMAANIFRLYNRIDTKISEHYSATQKSHKCEKGCAECCFNQTPISEIEYNLIQYEILRGWSQKDIEDLSEKVKTLWEILGKRHPELVSELETSYQGQIVTPDEINERYYKDFSDIPCPLLDASSKSCKIYSVRPMVCRVFGVSFKEQDPEYDLCSKVKSNEVKEFGCNVSDFIKDRMDLMMWENDKGEVLYRRPYPIIYHLFKSFFKTEGGMQYINNLTGKFQMSEDTYKKRVFEVMYNGFSK